MCRTCEDVCEPRAIRFKLALGGKSEPLVEFDQCTMHRVRRMRTLLPNTSYPSQTARDTTREDNSINICGCLVHSTIEKADTVRSGVEAMEGAEIHGATDDGRLVVVVEDTKTNTAADQIMAIHQIPGVISVTITYHHFEDLAANDTASLPANSSQAGDQTHDNL